MKITKRALVWILWMGRGAATAIGVSVVLAAVLGVGTAAMAAVPGDPFRLGQTNAVNALTALVGNRAGGAMMLVDNNSAAAGSRALDLRTEPGRAPLTVNADAGKAPNLNADRLDGKDSTGFLGANEKATAAGFADSAGEAQNAQVAADAGTLDGKDSAGFFSGKFYDRIGAPDPGAGNGFDNLVSISCDEGDVALGGGGDLLSTGPSTDVLVATGPGVASGGRTWFARFRDEGPASFHAARVRCADFPPLR